MALRPAGGRDMAGLLAVERECMGPDAWSEQALAAELAGVPVTRYVVVAERPVSTLAGYGVLLVAGETAEVLRVAVAAEYRGEGTGRALLDTLRPKPPAAGLTRCCSR